MDQEVPGSRPGGGTTPPQKRAASGPGIGFRLDTLGLFDVDRLPKFPRHPIINQYLIVLGNDRIPVRPLGKRQRLFADRHGDGFW